MNPEYWVNLKKIFERAILLPLKDREVFLDEACAHDLELRAAVESLINSHEEADHFIDAPAYQAVATLFTHKFDLRPGQMVCQYRIVSRLGMGGMGNVYLAEDTKLNRKVSLKFLSAGFHQDQEHLRRFRQEGKVISSLNHPNILTLYEIGEFEKHPFIATEFVDGQTLRQRLQTGIDTDEALEISIQIVAALVAAHRVGIVHRDIKPENIIIRGDDGLVKVVDFGLAKMMRTGPIHINETDMRTTTMPGVVMGTVAYMSPEQARGDAVDERTDIWSAGVVLYEMIAGSSPFVAATTNEILTGILSKEPTPPLSRHAKEVPECLQMVLETALRKKVAERYQTSLDLLTDLKKSLQMYESEIASRANLASGLHQTGQPLELRTADNKGRATLAIRHVLSDVRRRALFVTSLLVLFIIGSVVAYEVRHRSARSTVLVNSLAVLPLRAFVPEDNYLGAGIADAVIRKISQTGKLTVRPTSAVMKYAKQDTDALAAGRELHADAVLEGTVQRVNDRLRVGVNLLRTNDGISLWADSFDIPESDIFIIQDKVAQQVSSRLQLRLDSSEQGQLHDRYPTSPVAYEMYLKAVFSLHERGYGKEAMPQMQDTIDFFQKAIDLDPNYALAHAQLAFAYGWTALFIEPSNPQWVGRARAEIKRAQELGPQLAETHLANALLLWSAYESFQNEAVIRELLEAQQLNPNSGQVQLAATYGHIGLEDLASRELQRATETDPTNADLKDATLILPHLRGDADAWLAARQKLGQMPVYVTPWYYLKKGQLDNAQKAVDERLPNDPDNSELLLSQALLWALRGDSRKAQANVSSIIAKTQINDPRRHHATYDVACIYALAGNPADAVKWLRETANTGFPNYPLFARDPFLDKIRKAPEFVEFLSEQKAQWEKFKGEFGE